MRAEKILTAGPALAKTAKIHGLHADGGGLFLDVDGRGCRWLWRFSLGGKRRGMGLGTFPAVSLAEAREQRDQWRRELAKGLDPISERRARAEPGTKVPTF